MTQVITHKDKDDEIRAYHRKRLAELSEKSIGEIPQLVEPTNEQNQWVKRKMRGNSRSWEVWDKE